MSVFQAPLANLMGYINAANGLALVASDLTFSQPKPTDGTWQGVATTKNTKITLRPATGKYVGKVTVVYDRLQLGDFVKFRPSTPVPAYQITKVHDLLPALIGAWGLNLTTDDVENDDLGLTNGAGTFTLRAKATSLIWLGSVPVTVAVGGADLMALTKVTNLPGLNYPVSDPAQTSALVYMYPYDFTANRDALLAITSGSTLTSDQATALVNMIKAVDTGVGKALWNADAAQTAWSLAGAKVFFNGINTAALPTNSKFKYALGLELRSDVTIPTGRFYLQYNDPEDPNAA